MDTEAHNPAQETSKEASMLEECFAFQLKYWCRMRMELEKILSESAAHAVFYILGQKYGSSLCEDFLKLDPAISSSEVCAKLEAFIQANNWGELQVLQLDLRGIFRARVKGSFEVKKYYHAKQPSCFFLKGVFSGFLSTLTGRENHSTEIWCISQGGDACEFEVVW